MKTIIDTEVTKVKFLIERDEFIGDKNIGGDVFAYFPEETFSNGITRSCYAHVGNIQNVILTMQKNVKKLLKSNTRI